MTNDITVEDVKRVLKKAALYMLVYSAAYAGAKRAIKKTKLEVYLITPGSTFKL